MMATLTLALALLLPGPRPAARPRHADVEMRKLTSTKGLRIKDPDLKTRTFVDGNNLMMQQRVTKGRDNLTRKIAGVKSHEVIVVFDGRPGEPESRVGADPEVVVTQGGGEGGGSRMTADFWIDSQLRAGDEVVTADRMLRKLAQCKAAKAYNPVKWWRRSLPRLKGLKVDYSLGPNGDAGDDED